MSKHCWHKNENQLTTWTPGEAHDYTCCFCGESLAQEGTVEVIPGHGPHVRKRYKVTYTLPDTECPTERRGESR